MMIILNSEPQSQWVLVRIEGEGGNGVAVEEMGAGLLVIVGVCSWAQYEANPIEASVAPSL